MEIKKGDWVTGYHSGYYQVVGFGNLYGHRDDGFYEKGQIISNLVNLKKAFTSKMKFRLGADSVAVQWIKPLSEDVVNEIERFWVDNPDKKLQFDNYTAVEQLGDWWYEISIVEDGVEFWQNEVEKLPLKMNMQQFDGWFSKRRMMYNKQYENSKKKKHQYFITIKVIPESVQLGKAPLYEKPKMILGKK